MTLILSVLLVCLTVFAVIHIHVAPLSRHYIDSRYAKQKPADVVEIPRDLIGWADGYGAQWAVDDAKSFLLEEYGRLDSWDAVRVVAQSRGA